ncbi:MAG: lipid-A-disaccharide synthase [Candidatus Zixiibacteriota bacterium]|nr:MAG: lipid-A-disaccharide synthase [candidate division Zixibacteria bacterium]
MGTPLLFVSAGDPSGDNAFSRVFAALKLHTPDLELIGLGGPKLLELDQEQFADSSDLAVLGFWEVAKRASFFRKLLGKCVVEIAERRPSAVVLVDYPGFNLRLARRIKQLGIPVIYYISPQVWAWGKRRVGLIRECVDRMIVILPFEQAFFKQHDIACDFVGHYLLEDIPENFIGSEPPGNKQVALMPGSRRQEVDRMLTPMLETARLLNQTHGSNAVVAAVKGLCDYEAAVKGYSDYGVKVSYEDSRKTVCESDLVLTASGTATLETGIIGRPMVVVYKTGFITYQIARRLVKLDKIALVNLVLGKKVVPELIQEQATAENMAQAMTRYWTESDYRREVCEWLGEVPKLLGGVGASKRAAELIGKYL